MNKEYREIKFRGIRIDNGEWTAGHYYTSKYQNKNDGVRHFISYGDHWGNYEVTPETVGQLTGLKDKNGSEIYEGDILQNYDLLGNPAWYYEVIEWRGTWSIRNPQDETDEDYLWNYHMAVNVVGNKYQNPELLNKTS